MPGILIIVIVLFIVVKNSQKNTKMNTSKLESRLNPASKEIRKKEAYMEYLDEVQDESKCKYTTQDPTFSFEGLPNTYDDFAQLRKINNAHEKHLQKRLL